MLFPNITATYVVKVIWFLVHGGKTLLLQGRR